MGDFMNTRLLVSAAVAVLGFAATQASAAEVISISAVIGDALPAHATLITDFNSTGGTDISGAGSSQGGTIVDLAPGFTFNQDLKAYTRDGVAGLDSGVSAPPPLDNGVAGAFYETVLGGGQATLTSSKGLNEFSFYMGSPDTYNHVSFTFIGANGSQTLNGDEIWGGPSLNPGNGDQSEGFTITYKFSPDAVKTIVFKSDTNAFEFDKLAGIAVPEPASWALMIVGFGAAGAMLRGKRREATTA